MTCIEEERVGNVAGAWYFTSKLVQGTTSMMMAFTLHFLNSMNVSITCPTSLNALFSQQLPQTQVAPHLRIDQADDVVSPKVSLFKGRHVDF